MLQNLKDNEIAAATKLIFDGLSMAKLSMEQILQSPISIEKIDYGAEDQKSPRFMPKSDKNVHLIKTELKGDLKGTSYLIFTEEEVAKIFKACLPPNVLEDESDSSKMMKMGFLTEIDNMVAAAVITEFANFLGVEIYGHVPSLQVMTSSEVNDYMDKEADEMDSVIHFKAIFQGTELDIAPDFVWVFHDKFVDKIKEAV